MMKIDFTKYKIIRGILLASSLISLLFSSNSMAKNSSEPHDNSHIVSYNISYNFDKFNTSENYNFKSASPYDVDSNFNKDKFGKLISFNDEKIQNERLVDFVGMFTSKYNSNKKFKFKLRLDDDYKLQKAILSYRLNY